jgi:flagellar biosynthetic protein FliP
VTVQQKAILPFLLAACVAAFPWAAAAQTLTVDLGAQGGSFSGRLVQLFALLTVLSVAPGILVTVTAFTRIIIVLGLLRTALGLQQSPPNVVLASLALFLTFFVMEPYLNRAWTEGVQPLVREEIGEEEAAARIAKPFSEFMLANTRPKDLALFADLAKEAPSDTPSLRVLVPAFMISELRRAFEIGFLLFLPFLIIDMVISSILMAMGMMMLPPIVISLPFKLIFFVLLDGWFLVAGSLARSYVVP